MDDKQKRKFVAIARQLKEQKGITIKQSELSQDLKKYQDVQKKLVDIKNRYKESEAVQKEADKEYKKVQSIISDINEYMKVLHPEGLLDYGSSSLGHQALTQG